MLIALVDTHIKVGEGEVFGPAPASIVLELKNFEHKKSQLCSPCVLLLLCQI